MVEQNASQEKIVEKGIKLFYTGADGNIYYAIQTTPPKWMRREMQGKPSEYPIFIGREGEPMDQTVSNVLAKLKETTQRLEETNRDKIVIENNLIICQRELKLHQENSHVHKLSLFGINLTCKNAKNKKR